VAHASLPVKSSFVPVFIIVKICLIENIKYFFIFCYSSAGSIMLIEPLKNKMKLNISKKCIVSFTLYLLLFLFLFQSEGISVEDSEGIPAEANVYRDLVDKGVATYEDGCLAISYFAGIPGYTLTFDEVVAELKEKGIVGKRWKYSADKTLTRGIMAYMTCRLLKIRGGLTMRVINGVKSCAGLICSSLKIKNGLPVPDIGMTKRYAHLECLDMGLMPAGHKKTFLTGHDLLALMYRIEQHIKAGEKEKKQEEEKGKENEQEQQEQSEPARPSMGV
jgi:hypothetical protein